MSYSGLRIALLDASGGNEHTPRNFRREFDADLAEFDVAEGELPSTLDYDAAVVTGSRTSVYWDEPWMLALREWVGSALAEDVPFLGVCWGHQLLADVLGGTVEAMGEFEIGYREVTHHGGTLMEGVPERFTVFTTHSDRVVDLPPEATLLAENDYGIHGFRQGDVFGVQFHPEYDMETAEDVLRGKQEKLPEEQFERALASITEENYRRAGEPKRLFENFERFAERRRADRVEA